MAVPYPFSAIVAQDGMKQALLMAVVDPSLGGVMVFGDRGTEIHGGARPRGPTAPAWQS